MAFNPYQGVTAFPALEGVAAEAAFSKGRLVYRDTATGELKQATASAGTVLNLEGIALEDKTVTSADNRLRYQPVFDGMIVVADTVNNTAANQLNKAHEINASGLVNNTSTHDATVNGIFIALAAYGAPEDKKLIGRLVLRTGQVAA